MNDSLEPMIVPLFLDTDDRQHFSEDARAAVREVCVATEPEVRALLPALTETIELAAQTGTFVIPETGEVGMAAAPGRVNWTVDPSRPGGVAAIARSQLRFTLFHEFHHLVRGWVMNGGQPRTSFMDGVVSEGLATAFERDFGGRKPPWGEYPEDVRLWVTELLGLPASAPYHHWMFQCGRAGATSSWSKKEKWPLVGSRSSGSRKGYTTNPHSRGRLDGVAICGSRVGSVASI